MRTPSNNLTVSSLNKKPRGSGVTVFFIGLSSALLILLAAVVYFNYDYFVFKILIAGNYIYTDALDDIYESSLGEAPNGNYYKNFDDAVIAVFTEKIRAVNGDGYTYLYTPPQYALSQDNTKREAESAAMNVLADGSLYVRLPNFSTFTRDFLLKNVETMSKYNKIVFDLRQNPGGDLPALYDMVGLFLEKGAAIGTEQAKTPFFTKSYKAGGGDKLSFEKIAVLQDSGTASASEGFIMALRENLSNVVVIGEKSYGKGIGQITVPLKGGFAVKATVIRILTPLRNSIHKIGIVPDLEYDGGDILGFTINALK
ncbi:hypothetical protein FACS189490_06870 [Clostridia bacterium]|nr:hypothetical protein FACS189490_06870 [Clostridia bacterium]